MPAHWDLIPNNTNAMEGSHATDNRVSAVNRSLLEAILLYVVAHTTFWSFVWSFDGILCRAKQADEKTARVLDASVASGVLSNQHNSLKNRYAQQGQRKARSQRKKAAKSENKAGSSRGRKRTAAAMDGLSFIFNFTWFHYLVCFLLDYEPSISAPPTSYSTVGGSVSAPVLYPFEGDSEVLVSELSSRRVSFWY